MQDIYSLNSREKNSIIILKAIFTIMIVFIHANYSTILYGDNVIEKNNVGFSTIVRLFSVVIPLCAVPGFFLISSVLLYRKEFGFLENIRKKVKRLLL